MPVIVEGDFVDASAAERRHGGDHSIAAGQIGMRRPQNAAQRSIHVLLEEDLQERIARIPQGEDPDSLLRKQPVEAFQTLLHDAKDYTRHLLDTTCESEDISSPRGRGEVAKKMALVVAKIPNAVQREGFLLEVARRLQVSRSVLEEEVRKAEAQSRRPGNDPQRHDLGTPEHEMSPDGGPQVPQEPLEPDKLIEAVLALLLTTPELVPQVSRQFNPVWVEGLAGSEVLLSLLDAHAHDAWQDAMQFLEECDDRTRDYLTGLLMTPPPAPAEATNEAYADKLVQNFEKRWKQQRLQFLNLATKSDELSVEERMKYLTEIQAIRRQFPDLKP